MYSTWKILCSSGKNLIEKPLGKMLGVVPFFRKNLEEGKEKHRNIMDNRDFSFNIAFAFGYMFFTTIVIYAVIFLCVCYFFQFEVGDNLYSCFIAVVVLSYLTNEFLSWRNDRYLKYFTDFDRINNKLLIYLPAVLFHLGVAVLAVLFIYWTIGFNF